MQTWWDLQWWGIVPEYGIISLGMVRYCAGLGMRGILGYDEYVVIWWSIMQLYQGMVGKVR